MKVRTLVQIAVLFAAAGLAPQLSVEEKVNPFSADGRQMLATIKSELAIRQRAHGALRITEMTQVCEQFPIVGKTLDQANSMLKAAGQKPDLWPHTGPTSKPNQFAGGLVIESDGFAYSAVFNITLGVSAPTSAGRTIESVDYCNVLTRSL